MLSAFISVNSDLSNTVVECLLSFMSCDIYLAAAVIPLVFGKKYRATCFRYPGHFYAGKMGYGRASYLGITELSSFKQRLCLLLMALRSLLCAGVSMGGGEGYTLPAVVGSLSGNNIHRLSAC